MTTESTPQGRLWDLYEGLRYTVSGRSQLVDSKAACRERAQRVERRDVRVVEGARLESDPPARADAHQIPPTHFRSTTSRNIDTRPRVLVNHRVDRRFLGACDTVLTQKQSSLSGGDHDAVTRPCQWKIPRKKSVLINLSGQRRRTQHNSRRTATVSNRLHCRAAGRAQAGKEAPNSCGSVRLTRTRPRHPLSILRSGRSAPAPSSRGSRSDRVLLACRYCRSREGFLPIALTT